jgi:hypothetical protein
MHDLDQTTHLDWATYYRLGAPAWTAPASVAPATAPQGTGCATAIQSNPGTQERSRHKSDVAQEAKNARRPIFCSSQETHPISAPRLTCLPPAARGPWPAATWPVRGRSRRPYRAGRPWRQGRMGLPLGANRESPDGRRRWRGRWCVFLSPCIVFFFSVRWKYFFWKISAKPCAAHDIY